MLTVSSTKYDTEFRNQVWHEIATDGDPRFLEYTVLLHCHYSQVHSDPEW